MTIRDYSQHGEQQLITSFFERQPRGFPRFCVDAGAYDGVVGSNSRALFEAGWAGLAIEPNPRTFERLKTLYADRTDIACVCLAVSDHDASGVEMQFAVGPDGIPEEDKWQYAQVSTLNDDFAESYRRDLAYRYEKSTVDVVELGALMRRMNVPPDFGFLSIDCEGEDIKIVRKLDLQEFRPRLICVESDDNNRHFYAEVLEPKGYRYFAHTAGNTLFCKERY
jgi:FkbM family methyltransferase